MQLSAREKHKKDKNETLSKVVLSNLLSLLKIFLICFFLVYLTINFLVRPIHVSGPSMYPTIKDGEFGFSNAFAAKFMSIERGDVVLAYEGELTHKYWVKRVIGVPGDTVSCHNDVVYVNNEPIDETYLNNEFAQTVRETGEHFTEDFSAVTLGEDEYWLMGDNRVNSFDSRNEKIGPFKKSQIRGKDILIVFPFNKIRIPK